MNIKSVYFAYVSKLHQWFYNGEKVQKWWFRIDATVKMVQQIFFKISVRPIIVSEIQLLIDWKEIVTGNFDMKGDVTKYIFKI